VVDETVEKHDDVAIDVIEPKFEIYDVEEESANHDYWAKGVHLNFFSSVCSEINHVRHFKSYFGNLESKVAKLLEVSGLNLGSDPQGN